MYTITFLSLNLNFLTLKSVRLREINTMLLLLFLLSSSKALVIWDCNSKPAVTEELCAGLDIERF